MQSQLKKRCSSCAAGIRGLAYPLRGPIMGVTRFFAWRGATLLGGSEQRW